MEEIAYCVSIEGRLGCCAAGVPAVYLAHAILVFLTLLRYVACSLWRAHSHEAELGRLLPQAGVSGDAIGRASAS